MQYFETFLHLRSEYKPLKLYYDEKIIIDDWTFWNSGRMPK